jgi:hypothetical protein
MPDGLGQTFDQSRVAYAEPTCAMNFTADDPAVNQTASVLRASAANYF